MVINILRECSTNFCLDCIAMLHYYTRMRTYLPFVQATKCLYRTIDNLFKELRSEGIGSDSKHHDPISKQEVNTLWESRVLGTTTPNQLLNAVFFTVGLYCCLRGGEEHRSLTFSSFVRTSDPDLRTYTERASKNRQGVFLDANLDQKTVSIYVISAAGERCPVFILDLYFLKVPEEALTANTAFYLRPLKMPSENAMQPWFSNQVIGKKNTEYHGEDNMQISRYLQ